MEILKDWIYIIIAVCGAVGAVVRLIWRIHRIIKRHDDQLENHDFRIAELEHGDSTAERKLEILNRNVVKILQHLKIEPVKDLFEKEADK